MLSLSSNKSKTSLTYTGGGMAAKGQRSSYKQCYYGRSKGQRLGAILLWMYQEQFCKKFLCLKVTVKEALFYCQFIINPR